MLFLKISMYSRWFPVVNLNNDKQLPIQTIVPGLDKDLITK